MQLGKVFCRLHHPCSAFTLILLHCYIVFFRCNWEKFSAGYITPAQRIAPLLILLLIILGWYQSCIFLEFIWVFVRQIRLTKTNIHIRITCCCCCCFGSSQKKGGFNYSSNYNYSRWRKLQRKIATQNYNIKWQKYNVQYRWRILDKIYIFTTPLTEW